MTYVLDQIKHILLLNIITIGSDTNYNNYNICVEHHNTQANTKNVNKK